MPDSPTAAGPPPWFVGGPTASGKSEVAIGLAQRCGGEVVNADAFQLYRGLPLLTAQPAVTATVPHHLFGVLDPSESMDAAAYSSMARKVMDDIRGRGRRAIVVGGSGLYLKALTHGLPPELPVDPDLRRQLADWKPERRVDELLARDPAAGALVDLRNDRYVSRALELVILSGQPLERARPPFPAPMPGIRAVLLQRGIEELDERIRQRCRGMLEAGVAEEVRAADRRGVSPGLTKAIGYSACLEFLAGTLDRDGLLERLRLDTRRYAKRQRTWFRREPVFRPLLIEPAEVPARIVERAWGVLSE